MPKILKQVQQEVSHDEMAADLRSFVEQNQLPRPALPDGSPIESGDLLVPGPTTDFVAEDSLIYVVEVVTKSRVFYAAFYDTSGNKQFGFITPEQVVSRWNPVRPTAKAKPRKGGR